MTEIRDIYYSVVVPLCNEGGAIIKLNAEIHALMGSLQKPYEVIYVNDGSTDDSLLKLRSLRNVRIINLRRNYGQATALDAGFKASRGRYVISLDGDGQDDPQDIPLLLEEMTAKGVDVVAGWRKDRRDKAGVRLLSLIGQWLRKILINDPIHDAGCSLRIYTRDAIQSLDLGGEMHRYILALLRWKGFTISEVIVRNRPRNSGKSKYGPSKAARGLFDLVYVWFMYKYYDRPIHLFGYFSLISLCISIGSGVFSVYQKISPAHLSLNHNGWFFVSLFFLLSSIIFFSFGIVIDLLIRIYFNNSVHEKRYYIKDEQNL